VQYTIYCLTTDQKAETRAYDVSSIGRDLKLPSLWPGIPAGCWGRGLEFARPRSHAMSASASSCWTAPPVASAIDSLRARFAALRVLVSYIAEHQIV